MIGRANYLIEDGENGRALVVTGPWTPKTERIVASGKVDGLVLNYARGFVEPNLKFLDAWPLRHLDVLDRSLVDLDPIVRLKDTLEDLSVQAAAAASLDLGEMPRLHALAGEWELIRWQVRITEALRRLITWRYDEETLISLNDHVALEHLTIKDAPHLRSLLGIEHLLALRTLELRAVPALDEIEAISDLVKLTELTLEGAREIDTLDAIIKLTDLTHLGVADCGEIQSLAPLSGMARLTSFYGWGTTRIADNDLTPLLCLTKLADLRMRSRPGYHPSLTEITAALAIDQ